MFLFKNFMMSPKVLLISVELGVPEFSSVSSTILRARRSRRVGDGRLERVIRRELLLSM